jgi:hypothetical protein
MEITKFCKGVLYIKTEEVFFANIKFEFYLFNNNYVSLNIFIMKSTSKFNNVAELFCRL